MSKVNRRRRIIALVLALAAALWAVPAGAAAQVQITCSYLIDGEEVQRDGFSVVAKNEEGNVITSASPGETVIITATCPADYYVLTWTWETQADDDDASPALEWEISEDVSVLTIELGEEFEMTSLTATAQFAEKPPSEGPVALELTVLAPEVPANIAERVKLTAFNDVSEPMTSAVPGQDIYITAEMPGGYHVHSWKVVSVTAAGERAVNTETLDWNETAFTVPADANAMRIEAAVESGVALMAGCAVNNEITDNGPAVTVTDAQGSPVQCLKPGVPVTISAAAPASLAFSRISFYPSPDTGARPDTYLAAETVSKDPARVTLTLKNTAQINALTAILEFSRPSKLDVVVTPKDFGTVSMTPENPVPGDTVRLTASPGAGNTFAGWTTEGPEWLDVIGPADDERGTFSFVMPNEDVTVVAYFTNARHALDESIVQAELVLASIFVSETGGADCPSDMLWTTPGQAAALEQTIKDARIVAEDPRGAYAEAQEILEEAVVTFMNSAQEGMSETLQLEITEMDGLRLVRGLTLSPETGTSVPVAELKTALDRKGTPVRITAGDGAAPAANATCATGMIVSWDDDTPDAVVVVEGDVAGTGRISLSQLVQMAQAYAGIRPLEGAYRIAGSFSGSGKIGLTDLVKEAQLFSAYRDHGSGQPPQDAHPGQWAIPADPGITDTMREELAGAANLPSMEGVIYDPVACIGTQTADGTNYRILLTKTAESKPAVYVLFTMHVDPDGGAHITAVAESDAPAPEFTQGLPGGWLAPETPAVPPLVSEAVRSADSAAAPAALLGSQVVAGMNYLVCCEQNGSYEILRIYAGLQNKAEVSERYAFAPAADFPAHGSTNE